MTERVTEAQREIVINLRKIRAKLTRQRRSLKAARDRQHADIRLALKLGASPTKLAKASGYAVSRIYQIRDEGER